MPTSDFKKVSSLGKGSYGAVYKVQRKSDKKIYALKEVSIKTLKHEEREQSVNEIRILASLQHKSIIRYREAFLENHNLYIVTEYCRGGDLHRKIKTALQANSTFPEKSVWHYFIQMARGVEVLHANGILHRDLKPKNIFLTASNNVKIGDLGCSKIVEKNKLSQTQVGTPYYMSPEIWKRKPYDEKSDIWAMGCILFELELVSLGPPFLADNIDQPVKR
jgi:NIMA (never in mitosis gene a)-related kinase